MRDEKSQRAHFEKNAIVFKTVTRLGYLKATQKSMA